MKTGVFEAIVHDVREVLRLNQGRQAQPSPESGTQAGYGGAKRRKGCKTHIDVDTVSHLLALVVTPVNGQDRDQVGELCEQVQAVT